MSKFFCVFLLEIKVPGSNDLVHLNLPQIDRSELLEELADALYQERRYGKSSLFRDYGCIASHYVLIFVLID